MKGIISHKVATPVKHHRPRKKTKVTADTMPYVTNKFKINLNQYLIADQATNFDDVALNFIIEHFYCLRSRHTS